MLPKAVTPNMPHSYQFFKRFAVACLSLSFGFVPLAAHAQEGGKKPASEAQMNIYTGMGAVNICVLNSEGVSFSKSIRSSTEMILSILNSLHGDAIKGINDDKPIDRQRLANGSIVEMSMKVQGMCGDTFKGEDKKRLEDIISQIKKAEAQNTQGKGR